MRLELLLGHKKQMARSSAPDGLRISAGGGVKKLGVQSQSGGLIGAKSTSASGVATAKDRRSSHLGIATSRIDTGDRNSGGGRRDSLMAPPPSGGSFSNSSSSSSAAGRGGGRTTGAGAGRGASAPLPSVRPGVTGATGAAKSTSTSGQTSVSVAGRGAGAGRGSPVSKAPVPTSSTKLRK